MESAGYIVSAQMCGCIHFLVSAGVENNQINTETSSLVKTQGLPRSLGGRNLVGPELLEGREREPSSTPLLNACYRVPGIRVGVRQNSIKFC